MGIVTQLGKQFWKKVEVDDNKRIAGQTAPEGVTEVTDLPYLDDGNSYHLLDVYYPEGSEGEKLPVIIDIHGGGWMYGTKDLNKLYNLNLAKRGFTVFSLSYSLVPEVTVPVQLREIAAAFGWIHKHLSDYPCDETKLLLTGDSAGGQLALYSAVLAGSSVLRDVFSVSDSGLRFTCLALTSPVPDMNDGVMGVYTKVMWGKHYASVPTARYMNFRDIMKFAKLPPTYLVTSSGDVIARAQTRKTAGSIQALGVRTLLRDWEKFEGVNLPHVFSVTNPTDKAGAQAIDELLEFYRSTF